MGPNDANVDEEVDEVGVASDGPGVISPLLILVPLPYTPVRTPATIREIKPLARTPIALERAVKTLDDMRAATNTQERGATTEGVVYRDIGQAFNTRGIRANPNKKFWDPFDAIVALALVLVVTGAENKWRKH